MMPTSGATSSPQSCASSSTDSFVIASTLTLLRCYWQKRHNNQPVNYSALPNRPLAPFEINPDNIATEAWGVQPKPFQTASQPKSGVFNTRRGWGNCRRHPRLNPADATTAKGVLSPRLTRGPIHAHARWEVGISTLGRSYASTGRYPRATGCLLYTNVLIKNRITTSSGPVCYLPPTFRTTQALPVPKPGFRQRRQFNRRPQEVDD